jgi:ATP-binding cassette subfamily C protein CydCD
VRPLDPRLLRYAEATRGFLIACVVIGSAVAGLVVIQAFALADIITGAFQEGLGLAQLQPVLVLLAAVIVARAGLLYLAEVVAHRAGAKAKNQLRQGLLAHALDLGPGWLAGRGSGELATLATRGIDGLDAYFALSADVGAGRDGADHRRRRDLSQDLLSALIVALTLPLIPVFMILVGRFTQSRVDRQWRTLRRVERALPRCRGRAAGAGHLRPGQGAGGEHRRIGDQYRLATMKVLPGSRSCPRLCWNYWRPCRWR